MPFLFVVAADEKAGAGAPRLRKKPMRARHRHAVCVTDQHLPIPAVTRGPDVMLKRALQIGRTHIHRMRMGSADLLRPRAAPSLSTPRQKPAQMQKPPLRELSPRIESLRRTAIALLQPQPRWLSAASERQSLRQQIEKELKSVIAEARKPISAPVASLPPAAGAVQAAQSHPAQFPPMQSQPAPFPPDDAWFLQELLLGMRALDNYFLRSYDADAGEPLSRAMLPAQRRDMDAAVRDVFRIASDIDLQRLLAIIDPDVLSLLPVSQLASRPQFAHRAHAEKALARELHEPYERYAPYEPYEPHELHELYAPHALPGLPASERLNINEFLALVDYLHPYTCHYQVINGGLRLSRYWGVDGIAEASALLREPYLRALHKLQLSGLFTDRTGLYAKGIVAKGHARRLSHALDFLADRGGRVTPPHPMSATRWEQRSFARQPGRPEDTTIFIKVPEGLDVTPFHGSLGKSLGEVILMPQPLRLCHQDELPPRATAPRPGQSYLLEAAEPALRQRHS